MSSSFNQQIEFFNLQPDMETPSTWGNINGTNIHENRTTDCYPTPNITTFDSNKMTLKNSVIKGYHVFMIRPFITSPPSQLIVDRDYSNKKDPDACLVWLPTLETFLKSSHNTVTDEKRQLTLSD
ncbi:hypothetical protein DPMN_158885 [Dreissena polymorpha]|uniref:Uncharacterized protein n=1 Tax=Dreissena polymorpha TaxID=45954 RepID=A0A9D4EJS1_DREPO|nr:hypothetical protein DPMN_158885 [Dreissena polymorpha]